jgi:hypothetical protein
MPLPGSSPGILMNDSGSHLIQMARARVGDYYRMLSTYLNALNSAGFALERAIESRSSVRQAERAPGNREIPTLLLMRARIL